MEKERRLDTLNELLRVQGQHSEAIDSLKEGKLEIERSLKETTARIEHSFFNHKAETNGNLQRFEDKFDNTMKTVFRALAKISIFQYMTLGGGTAVIFIIIYIDNVRKFFGGH